MPGYNIQVEISASIDYQVKADTLEEAQAIAEKLEDFWFEMVPRTTGTDDLAELLAGTTQIGSAVTEGIITRN